MNSQAKKGIWQFADLLPPIEDQYKLTLGEGSTRVTEIDNIYFKHEYENPTGSIKDRGLAYQISYVYSQRIKSAVISSSGNAAISAANFCRLAGIELTVFVSPKIQPSKLAQLAKLGVRISQSPRPVSEAFKLAKEKNIYNLRPSKDPHGDIGYSTISYELHEEPGKRIDAIFFPVSSGTTLTGVAKGFEKLGYLPKLCAVQTTSVHPIASIFDKDFVKSNTSLADALVAKYTPRLDEVISFIKKSGGGGYIISDEEIIKANEYLVKNNINCSFEGAVALAGLWIAQSKGLKFNSPVCLLTGKLY
ncbi:hypothetical protein A2773_04985 [Candidatus Gottesmanbacteria bacterium RIFCSPHIGHO2_01_FULL_39_10]|uniref:Tryptophan synthase beta chain-like PALP domain-containing protein n=1 Tax=Candidatus Gottesmanbacteria bacterium RIFCSPHIGHO2_01_FULL_39_10 TaxID=1798375 RepID=A0A1F5ZRV9_9BACT|nr:MAG: hypothetical protein A2773_04985 [Candidatus Gottesmanbacteria bacterium RIFCSPHIGHO2_01_FULL_39_10]